VLHCLPGMERLPGARQQGRRQGADVQSQPHACGVHLVEVQADERIGASVQRYREVATVARRDAVQDSATPRGVVAEGRVEHGDAAGLERRQPVDDRERDFRRIGVPARAPGTQQTGGRVVRTSTAQEDVELR